MRKSLLLALLLLSFTPIGLRAQTSLFDLESDTVCVGQEVRIRPHAMNANSYYWGFCSGFLANLPLMDNLGSTFQLDSPAAMVVDKDGDNFFGFVVNGHTSELLRFDFGKSLANMPKITNFGNLDSTVTPSPNSLFLTKDSGKWYLFMCGGIGTNPAASSFSRIDFGAHLYNVPNGVRMGNPGNLLVDPRGIFVARQGPVYYGFVVNTGNNRLIRLNFGDNISRTPTATNVTIVAGAGGGSNTLSGPRDITPVFDEGKWYFFIPNLTFSYITRLYFGNTLSNNPVGSFAVGFSMGSKVHQPSAVTMIKDCGTYYAYIANRDSDAVLRYNVSNLDSAWTYNTTYNPTNLFNSPIDITNVVRDRDSLFAFILNEGNNSLTRFIFPQCNDASILSSNLPQPPPIRYDTAGLYNIYLAVNEGKPNMAIDCKQVRVINVPPITLSHDTLICRGDTLRLVVASQFALDYFFSPNYNISDTSGINIYVYPTRPFTYNIRIPFPDGCIVDTSIRVDVSYVQADAGPDRTIHDGASTIIGGANTVRGAQYTYQWFPTQFMDNPFSLNPLVNPPNDLTYYLKVTNTNGCFDIDTVNVKASCADLNLPNAFAPDNNRGGPKRFGLLNKQIVQLNYFRIFDRWGQEVFTTTDLTKQWDGNVGGTPAPLGVYVWEADGFCATGQRLTRSGNVTLIR